MEELNAISFIFLGAWTITRFEPLQLLLDNIKDNKFTVPFKLLLSCTKCVAFWLSLAIYQSFFIACLMAFIAFWYDKLLGGFEEKIKF